MKKNVMKGHKGFIPGMEPWNKGLHNYYETSCSTKQKKHDNKIGTKAYNNGERNIFLHPGEEIPEGFVPGLYLTEETRKKRSAIAKEVDDKRWHNGNSSTTTSEQTD